MSLKNKAYEYLKIAIDMYDKNHKECRDNMLMAYLCLQKEILNQGDDVVASSTHIHNE